jgi:23S rRNA pseudouridine1911/1915/1917 synthase
VEASSPTPKIIFQDNSLLVLDKPAGMVINRTGRVRRETLQDWLKGYLKIRGQGIEGRAGIVHRLDKETSGLLFVAKTEKSFKDLQKQFKERRVEKRYLALVHGKVFPERGKIEVPLSRVPRERKKMGVFLGGRRAITKYKILGYYDTRKLGKFSLLELAPETGRTHQIRVHLKFIGHPVVGDATYAGRKTARRDRVWCPRQFLHAFQIGFTHPETKKRIGFESSLASDLQTALTHLKSFR